MGGLAGVLALGGDVEEAIGFVESALGDSDLLVRGSAAKVESDDGLNEAAPCDLEFRLSTRGVGIGEAHGSELSEAEGFGDGTLTVVLVDRVVGDEHGERLIESALRRGG